MGCEGEKALEKGTLLLAATRWQHSIIYRSRLVWGGGGSPQVLRCQRIQGLFQVFEIQGRPD